MLQTTAVGVLGSTTISQGGAAQEMDPGDKVWHLETDDWVRSSPTVVDQTVYVGGWDGRLYAREATDGTEVWTFETGGIVWSPPAVVGETVYFSSDDGSLYAVDTTTGEQEWSTELSGLMSSPTVADGSVYIGSRDNKLYAFDATNGDELWSFEAGDWIRSSPTVVGNTVFVGSEDESLYAIDTETGDENWSFDANGPVLSSPTVADGTVYVGSYDDESNNALYAVNTASGEQEWNLEIEDRIWSSPTVADGVVYIGSFDNSLYAIDTTDGDEIWSFETDQSVFSSPTVVDETVYVGSQDNSVYAIDTADGEEIWSFETGGDIRSSPTVVDGILFVGSFDNSLYAINIDGDGSSDGSRVTLGTLGHHHEWAKADDPIKIEDWYDLDAMREELNSDYVLANDLDEDTAGYDDLVADPESGFNPIDNTSAEVFTGNFDGNGHEISNLRINRPDQDNIGVFGVIGDGAVIENVGLTNVTVVGGNTVGGLVGTNSFGDETISNSYVTGEVTGKTDVGGLVGSIGIGTIEDSYSTADVTGETQVGGLAGFTEDNVVSDSYATGTVTADNRRVAGLIGVTGSTDVSVCYATGDVNAGGADEVGGLVGESSGTISESYATGTVTGGNSVGGLVGDHFGEINTSFADATVEATDDNAQIGGLVGNIRSDQTITQSYALGSVDAENASSLGGFVGESNGDISQSYAAVVVQGTGSNIGGFIGESEGSPPEDSYWDTEVSGQGDSSGAEGLQTAELVGDSATDNMAGLDFDSIWETVVEDDPATTDDGYPILQAIDSQPQLDAQGIADSPDPDPAAFNVEITSPADGEEVTENESLDVDVDVTNVGGEQAEKTVELTAPIEDEEDVELEADETREVTFGIPGNEVDGEFTITVESPDDTDQVTVTAVDPCFIATAAYDTPAAGEIDILRDFRDDVLQRNVLGRLFIRTYYWGSPPIAQWIRRNRTRRELVKQHFVEPLVNIVKKRSNIWKRE